MEGSLAKECDLDHSRDGTAQPPLPPGTDAAGLCHPPAGAEARIASLVPSLTELLFGLGLAPQVVARTAFCRRPAAARSVPSIGGTKHIDLARLARCRPTHVLVNVDETPKPLFEALVATGCRVIVTHPTAVADNFALYRLLGHVFGRAARAATLAARLQRALALIGGRPPLPERRVLYLVWRRPWMTVSPDTYIARMLALVGWRTLPSGPAAAAGPRYPLIDPAVLAAGGIDLVLLPSEPFLFRERHVDQVRAAVPGFTGRVVLMDGTMPAWYGSRAILAVPYLRRLAEALAGIGRGRA
jgi:ABC-type Fe3+-hydroxamate transport system substrate-binding protein